MSAALNAAEAPGGAAPEPTRALAVPAIRVRHLWQRFGRHDVLQDVSFDVAQGEIYGFIGPNGAGKTTTIRIVATLLEPTSGHVEVLGHDALVDPGSVRRVLGYMADHSGVYQRLTVREYLEFYAHAYALARVDVVDAVIELTSLRELERRLVATLSKGMRQRLQVARILLHDPAVLVLDEPASDLDPRARIEIRDLLLELRELGKTIFLSSHILTELSDVCTSVGILEHGRLIVSGPIQDIAAELEARRAEGHARSLARPDASAALPEAAPVGPAETSGEPGLTAGGVAVPPAAQRRLRLRVLGEAEAVVPLIAGGTGIDRVEPSRGGQLFVYYYGDQRFVAELVRHLVAHGVGIVGVEPERNELERLFLEATEGRLQ